MNVLRARHVVLGPQQTLSPGEIEWDARGVITAVRRARGAVQDLLVMPGLVDAHVHLQLEPLASVERRFLPWVRAVLAARAARTKRADRASAVAALRQLLAAGTTAVGEIDSTGLSPAALRQVPLHGRCYQELTGFHLDARAARARIAERTADGSGRSTAGLSPHAPYSASAALIQAAAQRRRHLAIHCAEVPEEQQFLRNGTGPFAELLAQLGRLPAGFRAPGVGVVRYLQSLGVLGPRTQLVHCQELERGDVRILSASRTPVVVCPGTIEWFGRTPPPVAKWLREGIVVALGTDSRASNTTLSMPAELARAACLWPDLHPAAILHMATAHGASSLGLRHVGRIARGRSADLCAIAAGHDQANRLIAEFVHGALPIAATWLAGVQHRAQRVEPQRGGSYIAPRSEPSAASAAELRNQRR